MDGNNYLNQKLQQGAKSKATAIRNTNRPAWGFEKLRPLPETQMFSNSGQSSICYAY